MATRTAKSPKSSSSSPVRAADSPAKRAAATRAKNRAAKRAADAAALDAALVAADAQEEESGPSDAEVFAAEVVRLRDEERLSWAGVALALGVDYSSGFSSRLRNAYARGNGATNGVRTKSRLAREEAARIEAARAEEEAAKVAKREAAKAKRAATRARKAA